MNARLLFTLALSAGLSSSALAAPGERRVDFQYQAAWSELSPGAEVRIWAPLPQELPQQKVGALRVSPPLKMRFQTDDLGNRYLYLDGRVPKSGKLSLKVSARVERLEWVEGSGRESSSNKERERFLQPDRLVPTSGKVLEVARGLKPPEEVKKSARQLYDFVLGYMNYDKSVPGYGRGDSLWACDSRTGNCTDFHSLFMSLARSRGIPVRFEIGYPLAEDETGEISGYHCWAAFWSQDGWLPVDISEADKHPDQVEEYFAHLPADRVCLSVGRDLQFQPQPASGPLNYFVRPLLEVEGEAREPSNFEVEYSAVKD